jgi:hypothetical protein
MEIEFDKEIDAILRKARGGEVATSFDSHIDADEIAAFAENSLSDLTRQRYTAHLADCKRCRKILSNVIALNSEAELETASSAVLPEIAEAKTPWYRKLFAFPQIAYTMGGLVLVFGGFLGFLALKNLTNSSSSDVSFSTDKTAQMEKSAPQSAPPIFSNSNSMSVNTVANSTMTNSTASKPTTSTANSAPILQSNTPTSDAPTEKKSTAPEINATPSVNQPTTMPAPKPQEGIVAEDNKDLAKTEPRTEADKPDAAGAVRDEDKNRKREDSYSDDRENKDAVVNQQKLKTMRSAPISPAKKNSEVGETRTVSGKTFNNVGGIWFDSAVGKQKQKTVKRGTDEYLRLDSGLRSIADQLGGTVVILWSGKAYRIQ